MASPRDRPRSVSSGTPAALAFLALSVGSSACMNNRVSMFPQISSGTLSLSWVAKINPIPNFRASAA